MFNLLSKFQKLKKNKKWKIRWLFHATNFESLMYPCFTFCRIIGLFPYKIDAMTFKISKPCYIFSGVITCIACVYNLIILYDINLSKNIKYKSLPMTLERNCFYVFGGFIAVVTFILSGPRMHLIQTILEVSLRLPQESYQNLSRLIHAKDIFGFFCIIVQAVIFYSWMQFSVLRKILTLYFVIVLFIMDMLYMNCVCVLKACFKQINDNLMNLPGLVTNREIYFLRRTYYEQRNPFLLMQLKALKKQHLEISNTVQMLKIIFSLQLLSTISLTFIQITLNLYFYLVRVQVRSMSYRENQVYYNYFITAITFCLTKIVLIIWACETGKNQAAEISITVQDILNSTSDKETKYELHLFSLQLLHCENEFSVKGLSVDFTLLSRVSQSSAFVE
ncbi:uncharacterized protein LOC113003103 [Solenopsis invicta]|uniref:uncharacterized protein LOC113003103 n=1 Tax=Solenopsis invicta TaxID=13686 RepID=UPI00193D81FE|nr:uncharacterized protein LOC113003103 [Solenopsis invicta]